MSLLDFKDFLHLRKTSEPQPTQPVENMVTHVDQQLVEHHQNIEANVAQATQESVQAGSSIPAINTNPNSPLAVIQGLNPEDQAEKTESVIANTMPESYKKSSVGDTFGSSMKNTIDHLTGLDSNRYTTAGKFTEMIQKKAQDQTAVLQPGGELKKVA